jgi:hypothetical protein
MCYKSVKNNYMRKWNRQIINDFIGQLITSDVFIGLVIIVSIIFYCL